MRATGNQQELHGWDIHAERIGAGGAGVTEVR
jgi:hypothetical protein